MYVFEVSALSMEGREEGVTVLAGTAEGGKLIESSLIIQNIIYVASILVFISILSTIKDGINCR